MNRIKEILQGFYKGKDLKKQLPPMLIGVFMMGFSLSFLRLVDWGTDTFTNMNLAISARVGMSLGNWQLILNVILFILVIALGADNIGFGTIANMTLIGYLCDFFTWVWKQTLPMEMFTYVWVKAIVMVVTLGIFVLSAALYMNSGLGVSPCDAIPFIAKGLIEKLGIRPSIKVVRIVYDAVLLVIALAFGSKLYIATILMALTLGPAIELVGNALTEANNHGENKTKPAPVGPVYQN